MSICNNNLVNYVKSLSENIRYDSRLLFSTIDDIIILVVNRFYSKYREDDELFSIGRSKAILLLHSSHINLRSSLVNFIYTGVRNEIGNYLKKGKSQGSTVQADYNSLSHGNFTRINNTSQFSFGILNEREYEEFNQNRMDMRTLIKKYVLIYLKNLFFIDCILYFDGGEGERGVSKSLNRFLLYAASTRAYKD